MSLDNVSSRSHSFIFKENPESVEGYLSTHYWTEKPQCLPQNNRDSSLILFATKNQENPDPIAEEAHGLAMGTE